MLPPIDDQRWQQLLTGSLKHEFRSVPAGLMFSRLRREMDKDGSSAAYQKCLKEVYAFFEKYEKIMADDIHAIFM